MFKNLPMGYFVSHNGQQLGIPILEINGISEYEEKENLTTLYTDNGQFVVRGTVKQTIVKLHRTAMIWQHGEWDWDLGTETI